MGRSSRLLCLLVGLWLREPPPSVPLVGILLHTGDLGKGPEKNGENDLSIVWKERAGICFRLGDGIFGQNIFMPF